MVDYKSNPRHNIKLNGPFEISGTPRTDLPVNFSPSRDASHRTWPLYAQRRSLKKMMSYVGFNVVTYDILRALTTVARRKVLTRSSRVTLAIIA